MYIPTPILKIGHKAMGLAVKHGPKLMSIAGAGMAFGGAVMACKATLKAPAVIDKHNQMMATIKEAEEVSRKDGYSDYTISDIRRDKFLVWSSTCVSMFKLYSPAVAVGLGGIGLMHGAFGIMDRRQSATLAALTALDQAYTDVVARLPEQEGAEASLPYGIDIQEKPRAYVVKGGDEDCEDVDAVILQDFIPVEQFDIIENDPFTIKFDGTNENWFKNDDFITNYGFIKGTINTLEFKRSSYAVPVMWMNDIRRAFSAGEKALGWSYGYSSEPGDSILCDVIPCIYEKEDGLITGMRPILDVEEDDPRFDISLFGLTLNERRLEVLKALDTSDGELDNYCIVLRFIGSGPDGNPQYLRNKVY